MKWILGTLAVLAMLLIGTMISLPFVVSSETVRNGIITTIQDLTGRTVSFSGDPAVTINPFLGIEITNLIIEDEKSGDSAIPLLNVERMQAKLDLLPALIGNVTISEYRLIRPQLNLRVYEDGLANWKLENGFFKDTSEQEVDTEFSDKQLGTIFIEDGKIIYEDSIAGEIEEITNLEATFKWPTINSELNTKGNAILRGENIDFTAEINSPFELFGGGVSDVYGNLNSKPLTAEFDGEANTTADIVYVNGNVEANSPSLARLSDFLRLDLGLTNLAGEWKINGKLEGTHDSSTFTDASVTILGNEGDGTIRLALDELNNAEISGTLAFNTIDASPYMTGAPETVEKDTFEGRFKNINMDLRVSANNIQFGELNLESVAAVLGIQEENWVLDIGYSEAFEGTIIAKLGERIEEDTSQSFLELTARDLEPSALTTYFEKPALNFNGKTDIDANLRTNTMPEGSFLKGLNGTLNATITNGSIEGINLLSLLNTEEESQNEGIGKGQTDFEKLELNAFLNNGIASIGQANAFFPDSKVQLIGDINFVDSGIALTAQKVSENGPEKERLFIGGTLKNPLLSLRKGPQKPAPAKLPTLTQPTTPKSN